MNRRLIQALAIGFLFLSVQAFAQFNASVQGDVQDSSGAVIANATVKLVNTDTQVTRTATSDASGVYRFVSLAPGQYEVSASAPGFQTTKVPFTLLTEQNRQVVLTLAVGEATSNVSVTAQAPLLDVSDSRNQVTIDTQAIQALPLAARNPTSLITPGPRRNRAGVRRIQQLLY